jgi:hypothetical protein
VQDSAAPEQQLQGTQGKGKQTSSHDHPPIHLRLSEDILARLAALPPSTSKEGASIHFDSSRELSPVRSDSQL